MAVAEGGFERGERIEVMAAATIGGGGHISMVVLATVPIAHLPNDECKLFDWMSSIVGTNA